MERLAGRVILLSRWRRALVAFLAGAISVFALAPFDFFAVCFVSFPVLVWLLDGAAGEPGRGIIGRQLPAFATGWWFGFGYFLAGLWWLGSAFLVEAEQFAWALPFAVMGLPALLALYWGLAAVISRLLWSDDLGRIAALAFGFGMAEWLRAETLSGFPWNAIGYSAMPTPWLMQSASVIGLYGMNAVAVFVFAMPAMLLSRNWRRTGAVLGLGAVLIHVGYGAVRVAQPYPDDVPALTIRIVQPSIDQAKKWDQAVREEIFSRLLALSALPPETPQDKPILVVWPETAIPFLLSDRPQALVSIGAMLNDGQMLLTGAVRREGERGSAAARYYNSVVAINDSGEITGASDKIRLVPFGEYLPFAGLLQSMGLSALVESPGIFTPGSGNRLLALPGDQKALPLICYEAIFSDARARGEAAADILVNVTNDAWYGNTPGPYQHFRQAQLQAVERGMPLVRVANNGLSAGVDAYGRIIDGLALDAVGVLDVAVPLSRPVSIYAVTGGRTFPVILLLFAMLALVPIVTVKMRTRGSGMRSKAGTDTRWS